MEIFSLLTSFCQTNTYFIIENGEATVIDPGADRDKIVGFANAHNATIKNILITHAHFDHIGAVAELKEQGVKVYISEKDYALLTDSAFALDLGCVCIPVKPFDADVLLSDGNIFEVSGHKFSVIATPGHTPGGVCYIMDGKYIFSGDTLFMMSVGRTDFAFCSSSDLMTSVKKLFSLEGNYTVYPGHGESTTLDFERKNNPYVS